MAQKNDRRETSQSLLRSPFVARVKEATGLGASAEDIALFLLVATLFVHWVLSAFVVIVLSVYVLASTARRRAIVENRSRAVYAFSMCALFLLVSLIRQNFLSAGGFLAMGLYFVVTFWVSSFMTRRRFERFLDLCVLFQYVSVLVGLLQKFVFYRDKSDYLVTGPTINANYYGLQLMMVSLIALFCLFRYRFRRRLLFYLGAALSGFFMILLAQSMANFFGFLVGVFCLLFYFRCYRTFSAVLGITTATLLVIFALPLEPIRSYILYPMQERVELWKIALHSVFDNGANALFGQGLFSFQELWDNASHAFWEVRGVIPRRLQPHSHNLYVECLLALGVFGSGVVCGFVGWMVRLVLRRGRLSRFRSFSVMLFIIGAATAVSNFADATLLWTQSGFLFFLLFTFLGIPLKEEGNRAVL